MNLVKAEFLKLAYQRRTWGLLVAAIFLSVLGAALSPWAISRMQNQIVLPLSQAAVVDSVYSKALGAYIIVLIIGIIVMSSEFHHHTAIATFLATPKRTRVLTAKLITAAIWGAAINLVGTLVGMTSAAIALSFYKDAAQPDSFIWVDYPAAAVLIGAVLAVVGVGIGTLIRNQNGAVATGLVFFLVVDRILAVVWTEGGKYLPTGLISAMMQLHLNIKDKAVGIGFNSADYLDPLPAAGLMLVYAAVFAVAAIATTMRRDID